MGKKILIVGGGGREHSLAWKLYRSPHVDEIFACPGNPGISEFGSCIDIKDTDIEAIRKFAKNNNIDLTIIGPEVPLAMGVVDEFNNEGLTTFGPNKDAAEVEASKLLAKKVLDEGNVPTAKYAEFVDYDDAYEYVLENGTPLVIKADGLAYGKGTYVAI
jgi:phosphoribosylamine--glycine ligase